MSIAKNFEAKFKQGKEVVEKSKMVSIGVIEDNEFGDKYVRLINDNLNNLQIKAVTQRHHILPKYFIKANNLKVEDCKNIVNLQYKDHILAHYYLYKSCSNNYYKFSNLSAIKHLIGSNKLNRYTQENNIDLNSILENLDYFQELYQQYCLLRKQFVSTKGCNQNKIWMNDGVESKRVSPEDIAQYLENGFKVGALYATNNGMKWVHNDNVEKLVQADMVSEFLSNGWSIGRSIRTKSAIGNTNAGRKHSPTTLNKVAINNGDINKFVDKKDVEYWTCERGFQLGLILHQKRAWHCSMEKRDEVSKNMKNKIWINKNCQNKRVDSESIEQYLQDGYVIGRYFEDSKVCSNKMQRCWVTKDGENKSIPMEQINFYIKNGQEKGRNMLDRVGTHYEKHRKTI